MVKILRTKDRALYSFNLVGQNVTKRGEELTPPAIVDPGKMNIQPSSYCILTGAGTFDPSTHVACGDDAFTHINNDGAFFCYGTWKVKSFERFDSGKLVVAAEFIREYTPLPGYPKGSIGTLFLEIGNDGWKVFGDPGLSFPIFNVIESGQVYFHPDN